MAGQALAAAIGAGVPVGQRGDALQAGGQARLVAEHGNAIGQRLAPGAVGQLVDEALGEEGGIAVGIAAQPPAGQRNAHRHMFDRDIGNGIGRHCPVERQRIARALGLGHRGPGVEPGEQALAKLAPAGRGRQPRLPAGQHPRGRDLGGHDDRDRRARPAGQMLLPARPGQLHRPADGLGDGDGLDRVIVFQPPVEAAAGGHRIEHHLALRQARRLCCGA